MTAGDAPAVDPPAGDPPAVDPPAGDPPTGDDAALDAIRNDPAAAHRTIEALKAEAADNRRRLRKVEQDLERAATAGLGERERELAEAEQRGRDAARAEHGRKLLEAQLRAAAAGKLQDPDDAVRYLDVDALLELDDGELELDKRVATLLESKPYLAAAPANGGEQRVGARSQGARTQPGGDKASEVDGSAWLRKAARRQ